MLPAVAELSPLAEASYHACQNERHEGPLPGVRGRSGLDKAGDA